MASIDTIILRKSFLFCEANSWSYQFLIVIFFLFSESETRPLAVYSPTSKPGKYNSTVNPITVDLYLDPSCRYTIDIKHSFSQSVARIVQLFTHWLPAHLVAVLLLTLKHQMSLTPKDEEFKCGSLRSGLLSSSSFFIITGKWKFISRMHFKNN